MKNNTKHQETEQKKMFFDSDGFNFCINLIIGILKVGGMLLVVLFNIIGLLIPTHTKRESHDHIITHSKEDGSGYNDNGDRVI